MLSNRIAAAVFGAGALLFTGLAAAPASAAPIAAGSVPATTGQIEQVQYYWPAPLWPAPLLWPPGLSAALLLRRPARLERLALGDPPGARLPLTGRLRR